jgi:hypothetical protein
VSEGERKGVVSTASSTGESDDLAVDIGGCVEICGLGFGEMLNLKP